LFACPVRVFIHCSPAVGKAFAWSGARGHRAFTDPEAWTASESRRGYHQAVGRHVVGAGAGSQQEGIVSNFVAKIVAWITSGYPEGVPGPDRVPLFALLKRRLTDEEIRTVVTDLLNRGEFDHIDIWPLDDARDSPDDAEGQA
jgi:hypothetical protein